MTTTIAAALQTPLPSLPADEPVTPEQWQTLMAIMDTVIPSLKSEHDKASDPSSDLTISDTDFKAYFDHLQATLAHPPDEKSFRKYLVEKPSENPEFLDLLRRQLLSYTRGDKRKALAFILTALNTRLGSFLLTGYTTPIDQQPIAIRTTIIQKWRESSLSPLRLLYKQFTLLSKNIWLKTSPGFTTITGFPKTGIPSSAGKHHDYQFLTFPPGDTPETIETDVVIVGSGCGGGVMAARLSAAGHRVLVLEKSYYYDPTRLPMTESTAGMYLFDNGGSDFSDDGSISIFSGSTWGGGGAVNWAASLQVQEYVRKEWAKEHGLEFFAERQFQRCLDSVCERMGVKEERKVRHNHGNQVLLEGARRLGLDARSVPQNTGMADEHECGAFCTLGCREANKQGPNVSWLADAAKNGAQFVEGVEVENILFSESGGKKTATGVKGTWTSRNKEGGTNGPAGECIRREISVKAKKVIVSCGTIWSPILLLMSGLNNPHIGRNLHCHPVNFVLGVFKEEIRPWKGPILSSAITSLQNIDSHGHGVKLEATVTLPSLALSQLNWVSGQSFKVNALKYPHTNGFISLTRDRDSGRVYPYTDPVTGKTRPSIQYTPSRFDRENIWMGILELTKVCYVMGAMEIHVCVEGVDPFLRQLQSALDESEMETDLRFKNWLLKLASVSNAAPAAFFASAHQMGTNRMSSSSSKGVVDQKGRVWDTEGLYVADASVFPSASGVNPMVTNMAICEWISNGLIKDIEMEKENGTF